MYLRMTRSSRPSFPSNRLALGAALYLQSIGYDRARLAGDVLWSAIRAAGVDGLPPVRTKEDFEARFRERRGAIDTERANIFSLVGSVFAAAAECSDRLESAGLADDIYDAIETQLAWLVIPGFAKSVTPARLGHYARYLKGARVRIDRARANPSGDRSKESRFAPYWERCREALVGKGPKGMDKALLAEYRWMVEEFRISVFAPELRTPVPVSEKRLDALWSRASGQG